MRTTARVLGIAALGLHLVPIGVGAQATPEALSIVDIEQIDAGGHWKSTGTGFIVSPDGTVITASHVVYEAFTDPEHYRLLILYDGPNGREFFSAEIVCSTKRLPGPDPAKDAAILRITLPTVPYRAYGNRLPGGQRYDWIRHEGPLPEFPALHIADHGPSQGEHIRAPGYGFVSVLPRISVATGVVEGTMRLRDGTPLFGIQYINPLQSGGSGSPVLNANGDVIGLIAWGEESKLAQGWAQDVSVVRHPCS